MWYSPEGYKKEIIDLNQVYLDTLKGDLEKDQARITLIKFLRNNLTFTTELLTGIQLAPYQEINLKGMLNRNYAMCVWGRGIGKTFTAAVYCILQTVFEPNTNILIAGPTFRTARFIFNHIEKIADSPDAKLLFQALGAKSKRSDEFEWRINGGSIRAIPLNGEKIRGFRANVLVIDEFLLMPEDIIKNVLMPFLVAPQDMKERIKIRSLEDQLIRKGAMKESDRIVFENNSKMIALSSASYTFENLYKTYSEWSNQIYTYDQRNKIIQGEQSPKEDEEGMADGKYFISQMAWNSIPDYMIDKQIIKLAASEETRSAAFQREYCAQFTDGSDSYFSAKKMQLCTIADGEEPHMLLTGKKDKKYVLSIDPNFSNSPTSDYFAMSVMELDPQNRDCTLVHGYGVAGKDLKDHIKYLYYILKNFNIEMIIIDYAGYQFIEAANEHELFKRDKIELKIFEFESDKDGIEYEKQVKQARKSYNKEIGRIVFTQYFTTDFIRKGNEWLQGCIDYRKLWFASRINPNASAFTKSISSGIDVKLVGAETIGEHIDQQDFIVYDTKKQCASIEVKSSTKGIQTFDLPQSFKHDTTPTRPRKDNYTTLMLGAWGVRCYHDIMDAPVESNATFVPFAI